MRDARKIPFHPALSRRSFLRHASLGSAALLTPGMWRSVSAAAPPRSQTTLPLEHVIISCQENRSFDHYFGFAPQVQVAGFGPSAIYAQPDGHGGQVKPYEFTALSTADVGHSWTAAHPDRDVRRRMLVQARRLGRATRAAARRAHRHR